MKTFLIILVSIIIGTLFIDSIAWFSDWLYEKPFDKLGWLSMYVEFFNFKDCQSRIDYFMQVLGMLLTVLPHFACCVLGGLIPMQLLKSRTKQLS